MYYWPETIIICENMVLYNLEGCLKTFRSLALQRDFFGQNFSKEANITKKLRNATFEFFSSLPFFLPLSVF